MSPFYSQQQLWSSLFSSVGWIAFCILTVLTTIIELFTENLFTQVLNWLSVIALGIALISFLTSLIYGGLAFPRFESKNRFLNSIESLFNFAGNPKVFIFSSFLLVAVFYGVFMTNGVAHDLFMIACSVFVGLLFLPNTASLIRVLKEK